MTVEMCKDTLCDDPSFAEAGVRIQVLGMYWELLQSPPVLHAN